MATKILKSNTRGYANHGWLKSYHSFSFASYYNPDSINFGMLRVLNDDTVDPGKGFGTHPHDNMEIISIPLKGSLAHKDSEGHAEDLKVDEIQVMSAGTGIYHSEFNPSTSEQVNFLQLWILPNKHDVKPRYEQKYFADQEKQNKLLNIVSPDGADGSLWIHQNAWLYLGQFKTGEKLTYETKKEGNGIFLFLIEGNIQAENEELSKRDALQSTNNSISIETKQDSEILIIDIPLKQ